MSLTVVTQIAPEDGLVGFKQLLQSLTFADKIIVYAMEMEGNQDFIKLANLFSVEIKFIARPKSKVVEAIRAQQVKQTSTDWVLIMDVDELIPPVLAQEISSIISGSNHFSAYQIPRQNFSLGYQLKHGGWGMDYVPRLFYRTDFLDWPTDIHSTPTFKGQLGTLTNFMEHHKDPSLEFIVNKTNRYTDKEANQYYQGGMAPVTSVTLLRKLNMEIIRRGIFKLGILDGAIGIIQSIYQGFSVFMSYAKLYEKQHSNKKSG